MKLLCSVSLSTSEAGFIFSLLLAKLQHSFVYSFLKMYQWLSYNRLTTRKFTKTNPNDPPFQPQWVVAKLRPTHWITTMLKFLNEVIFESGTFAVRAKCRVPRRSYHDRWKKAICNVDLQTACDVVPGEMYDNYPLRNNCSLQYADSRAFYSADRH